MYWAIQGLKMFSMDSDIHPLNNHTLLFWLANPCCPDRHDSYFRHVPFPNDWISERKRKKVRGREVINNCVELLAIIATKLFRTVQNNHY